MRNQFANAQSIGSSGRFEEYGGSRVWLSRTVRERALMSKTCHSGNENYASTALGEVSGGALTSLRSTRDPSARS